MVHFRSAAAVISPKGRRRDSKRRVFIWISALSSVLLHDTAQIHLSTIIGEGMKMLNIE